MNIHNSYFLSSLRHTHSGSTSPNKGMQATAYGGA